MPTADDGRTAVLQRLGSAGSWVLLGLGLALTLVVASRMYATVRENDKRSFEQAADDVTTSLLSTLRRDTDLVASLTATLSHDPGMTNAQFNRWLQSTDALGRLPGGVGFVFIQRVTDERLDAFSRRLLRDLPPHDRDAVRFSVSPPGARPEYCFIRLAAYASSLQLPLGLDLCATDVEIPGYLRSSPAPYLSATRFTGEPAVMPLELVPGLFAVVAPIYRGGALPSALTDRGSATIGWAAGTFDARGLLATSRTTRHGLKVEIWHRDPGQEAVLVIAAGEAAANADERVTAADAWTVRVAGMIPRPGLSAVAQSRVVLAVGTFMTLLLFGFVRLQIRGRRRALRLVARRTAQLRRLALHDPLTQLPNRALILDRIEQALARSRRGGRQVAVLFLDLDGFKLVNDTLGHAVGDELLREVAERLTRLLRASDSVGRLGGDEFVVLVEGDAVDAGAVAERIREELAAPFALSQDDRLTSVQVRTSVGIAIGPRSRAEDLLRDADIALYEAKQAGRDRVTLFAPEMLGAIERRVSIENDLRGALDRDELFLDYQPIVDLASNEICGAEALLRWRHPERGVVAPDQFIGIAEASGLIVPIGAWVLDEACRQASGWQRDGRPFRMSVNMSGRQLEDDADIVGDVSAALARSGLDPALLTLEITESVLLRDSVAATRRLHELKAVGVRVAIDDFGTGYSSITYLRQFPCDTLKIDRSFVHGIAGSSEAAALVRTLVQLGKNLGIETLAEGIEDVEQLRRLVEERCDRGQGFLFARPLNPDAMNELVGVGAAR